MTEKKTVKMETLEDLAIIAWHRAIVMKQKVTVLCPDPEAFVPAMLQLITTVNVSSWIKVNEFTKLVDAGTLLKESEMELKKSDVLGYEVRD